MIKQFLKKLIQYYIDLIVSWYRQWKTRVNIDQEIEKFHKELDQKNKPIIREVGKFGDKDWSISIGDIKDDL